MQGRLTSLTNTDSQTFLLLKLNHENEQLSSIYLQQVSQATHTTPTHFYFLPAAVPLNTKPIISTNKLNSPSRVPCERCRSGFAALVPELARCPKGPGVRGTKVIPELSSESPGALGYGGSHLLPGTPGVEGSRGWEKARGARTQAPGCCAASLLSKCNKSNKVSLQPLAQAASKGTLWLRTLPTNEWRVNSLRPRGSG